MRSLLTYGLFSFLFCLVKTTSAQGHRDTTVQMSTVPVVAINMSTINYKSIDNGDAKLDSKYQTGKRLSDILVENTSVFVKNYGVGQLSSISINGSSAAQTSILWNGIRLNSPATGQTDLALFDMGTVDRVRVINGASNQSVGGTLALSNMQTFDRDTLTSSNVIRYGSFNTLNLSSANNYTLGIFSGSTKINYLNSDNDFPFVNNTQIGAPIQRQTNGATALLSFLQQVDLRIRRYHVGAIFWVTDADRQLSPTMTEAKSYQHEWDRSYRTMAYLIGTKGHFDFSFKTSYLNDWLRYTDPIAMIDSRSLGQAMRNLFDASYTHRNRLFLNGFINYDFEQVSSTGFSTDHARHIAGVTLSAAYRFWNISKVGLSARQELLGTAALPFAPSGFILIGKPIGKSSLYARLSGARAYRVPALNDLYWSQGGNANLRPEHAWNSSLSIDYGYKTLLNFNANFFYNYVADWILWHPQQNGIWTPDNLKRVLSRGVNLGIKFSKNWWPMSDKGPVLKAYAGYSYTNTISLDAISANDNSQSKQLIYVPLHNFSASLQLQYWRFYIRTINSITGVRYTTTDNSQSLPAYFLTHLEAGKDFYFNNRHIGISLRVNNLTNSQYQVVEQRAMPGRSYEMTVSLNFSK